MSSITDILDLIQSQYIFANKNYGNHEDNFKSLEIISKLFSNMAELKKLQLDFLKLKLENSPNEEILSILKEYSNYFN